MTSYQGPTQKEVISLARQLGIGIADDQNKRIEDEISDGISGYSILEETSTETAAGRPELPTITINPGEATDPHNAFTSQFELQGTNGPLSDLKVALKDNIAVEKTPLTCGSEVFAETIPQIDAAVVEHLLDAGATLIGKTNMDELAYGPTGETSAFGPTENPSVSGHVAGGSSSGSAAAVAANTADVALGTDTGGSVRIPASFCGLVGFKPTWGAISRFGVVELSFSLDHVGVFTHNTHTAARVLDELVGSDIRDPSTAGADAITHTSFVSSVKAAPDISDLTLGIPEEFFGDHVSKTVEATIRAQIDTMAEHGAKIEPVSIPLVEQTVPIWNAIVNVELATFIENAAASLYRRGPKDAAWQHDAATSINNESKQFGDVIQTKSIEGKYLLQEYDSEPYIAAQNLCYTLFQEFETALNHCDFLVTPTMPTQAPEIGDWSSNSYSSASEDSLPPLAVNTRPADLAGLPAVTVPTASGTRPIGIQFIGGKNEDTNVLAAATAFERLRNDQ